MAAVTGTPSAISDEEGKSLVRQVVNALGGESNISLVKGVRYSATRDVKTPYGNVSVRVEMSIQYPDRVFFITHVPQGIVQTVVSSDSGFMNTGGKTIDLPARKHREALRSIQLGIIYVAQHASDPELGFSASGEELIAGTKTKVLVITVNGFRDPVEYRSSKWSNP